MARPGPSSSSLPEPAPAHGGLPPGPCSSLGIPISGLYPSRPVFRATVPPCHSDAVAHGRGAPRDTCAHPSSPPRPARTPAPCFEAEAGGSLDQPRSRKGPVAPFQTILCFSLFWLGSRTHYPL